MRAPETGVSGHPQGYRHKLSLYHYGESFVPFFCSCCCHICAHPRLQFLLTYNCFLMSSANSGVSVAPATSWPPPACHLWVSFSFFTWYHITSPSPSLQLGFRSHRTDCLSYAVSSHQELQAVTRAAGQPLGQERTTGVCIRKSNAGISM